jgi:SAM-dependent methyltransferase
VRIIDEPARGRAPFRCPDCFSALHEFTCQVCGRAYGKADGIPDLLGGGPLAKRYREIGAYYDALYTARTDVWREQGHTNELTRYIVDLVEAGGPGRYLDVGCGEGFFLAEARRMERFGVDISPQALRRARARSRATVAIAAAENLPFLDSTFDVVTSVGAMEHFLDDVAATAEIRRVLKRSGRYILALLVEITLAERLHIKAREFLWPQPRPRMLARWLLQKARPGSPKNEQPALPQQPVQNLYHPRQVRTLFGRSGFRTVRLIAKATSPEAPLPGHYMRIYDLEAT